MTARTPSSTDERHDPFDAVIGQSQSIMAAKDRGRRLALFPRVPVLITGETGTGKEVFARALHQTAHQPGAPFVAINCGAVARELLSSDLFGYAEGAFTGARRGGSPGKLEAANGGTLFLDELGELPLELQPQLLRVLESGEFYRLGDTKPRRSSFRLLAATNRDLEIEMTARRFRADLYYRVAVASVKLPPLRERGTDVCLLAAHFLRSTASEFGLPSRHIDEDVLDALSRHPWPGNIRELRNHILSMSLTANESTVTLRELPEDLLRSMGPHSADDPSTRQARGVLRSLERQAICEAVIAEEGNLTRAAEHLGLAKSTLYHKLKKYDIDKQAVLSNRGRQDSVAAQIVA